MSAYDYLKSWSKSELQMQLKESEDDLRAWLERGEYPDEEPSPSDVQEQKRFIAALKKLLKGE